MRFILTILLCVGLFQANAQLIDHFRHSMGAGTGLLQYRDGVSPAFGLHYNPQINYLDRHSDFSLSVAMPFMIGGHIASSFVQNSFFYAKVPLITEMNIGHNSTRDFTNAVGMSLGGGYAIQVTDLGLGHAPVATASVRTWVKHVSITIRYVGMYYINSTPDDGTVAIEKGYNTHTLTLAINLGHYLSKVKQMNKISKWMNPFRN